MAAWVLPHRLTLLSLLLLPVMLRAQRVPASQAAATEQDLGPVHIRIDYSRPVARDRVLFGGVVPWGHEWNPGADSATRLTTSGPVLVNGKPLAAGSYSLWAIPDSASWTVIFSRAAHVYHVPYPPGEDALRLRVAPRVGPHMETLAFYFPVVDGSHAVLRLHWGTTMIPLIIDAGP